MRKIGNILTNKKIEIEGIYNVVSSKDCLIVGIPTLVIGWEFTKENYPTANIIDWKINDTTFWTFGNRERRSVYDERISKFKDFAVDYFVKSIKYIPFSVITEENNSKREFFNFMENDPCEKKIYTRNDMVYIYVPKSEAVYGISLRDITYIGKDVGKFLSKVYHFLNAESVNGKVTDNMPIQMMTKLRNYTYIVPCLCYDND